MSNRAGGGRAVAVLVIGVVAFFAGLVPFLGTALGFVGIALGARAVRTRERTGLAWAGLLLSAVAVLVNISTTIVLLVVPLLLQSPGPR